MSQTAKKYVAIKDDLLSKPLYPLEGVRLLGTRCRNCGEVFFGRAIACQACQGDNLESITLSRTGKLYSYTVNRGRPPGDYKGPEPFQPFAVGLVELPEGIRVLSVLTGGDVDQWTVNMDLELVIEELCEDEEGNTVVTYKFRPKKEAAG